jgi:hypothetical protein
MTTMTRRSLWASLLPLFFLALLLPGAARADATAKISVDVIQGTKDGAGPDAASTKHKSVLDQMPQFKGFRFVETLSFDAPVGQHVTRNSAGRALDVFVQSLGADKATTRVEVTDPQGRKHGLTSSLKRGASMVVAAKSADGSEVHLFIVRVDY